MLRFFGRSAALLTPGAQVVFTKLNNIDNARVNLQYYISHSS